MAYLTHQYCSKCNGDTNHINGKCNVCSILEKETKEEEWKSLKIEDKIEALKKRIEKLEAKDKRY